MLLALVISQFQYQGLLKSKFHNVISYKCPFETPDDRRLYFWICYNCIKSCNNHEIEQKTISIIHFIIIITCLAYKYSHRLLWLRLIRLNMKLLKPQNKPFSISSWKRFITLTVFDSPNGLRMSFNIQKY